MALALGVLISGRGSNLVAILDAIQEGTLDATVNVVITNKEKAGGLELAKQRGILTQFIDPKQFVQENNRREAYDLAVGKMLQEHRVECVVLAGYMRIVTPALIRMFPSKMVNIHPSLLPAFPGLDAQRQALEHGAKVSGCSVHFVTEGVDEGPIICQKAVEIKEEDTAGDLVRTDLRTGASIVPSSSSIDGPQPIAD